GNARYNPAVAGGGYSNTVSWDYGLSLTLADPPPPDAIGDTLATALVTGLGTAASSYTMPSARIGDGTWAELDVDLYKFTAAAGQKLTARTSIPAGVTDLTYATLRLFDAAGHELVLPSTANLSDGTSRLD